MNNESWAAERAKEALQKIMEDSAVWRVYANTSRFQEAVDIVTNAILEARGVDAQGFEEAFGFTYEEAEKENLLEDYEQQLALWNRAFAAGAQSRSLRLPSDELKKRPCVYSTTTTMRCQCCKDIFDEIERLNATKKPDEKKEGETE